MEKNDLSEKIKEKNEAHKKSNNSDRKLTQITMNDNLQTTFDKNRPLKESCLLFISLLFLFSVICNFIRKRKTLNHSRRI
jgi:hypothetical protein